MAAPDTKLTATSPTPPATPLLDDSGVPFEEAPKPPKRDPVVHPGESAVEEPQPSPTAAKTVTERLRALKTKTAVTTAAQKAFTEHREQKAQEFSAANVQLSDGSWVDRKAFETLPEPAKVVVRERGVTALKEISALSPEAAFPRLQELGLVPADAKYEGTTKKGEIRYSTPPPKIDDLRGKSLRDLYAKVFPERVRPTGELIFLPIPQPPGAPVTPFTDDDRMRGALKGHYETRGLTWSEMGMIGTSLIPIYGTWKFWHGMSPVWRGISVAGDLLFFLKPAKVISALKGLPATVRAVDVPGLSRIEAVVGQDLKGWKSHIRQAARKDPEMLPLAELGEDYARAFGVYAEDLTRLRNLEGRLTALRRVPQPPLPISQEIEQLGGRLQKARAQAASSEKGLLDAVEQYTTEARAKGVKVVSPGETDFFSAREPIPENLAREMLTRARRLVDEATKTPAMEPAKLEERLSAVGREVLDPSMPLEKRRALSLEMAELREKLATLRTGVASTIGQQIRETGDLIARVKALPAYGSATSIGRQIGREVESLVAKRATLEKKLGEALRAFEGPVVEPKRPKLPVQGAAPTVVSAPPRVVPPVVAGGRTARAPTRVRPVVPPLDVGISSIEARRIEVSKTDPDLMSPEERAAQIAKRRQTYGGLGISLGDIVDVGSLSRLGPISQIGPLTGPTTTVSPFVEPKVDIVTEVETQTETEAAAAAAVEVPTQVAMDTLEPRGRPSGRAVRPRLPPTETPSTEGVEPSRRVAFSWRQGKVWITVMSPFSQDDVVYTTTPPVHSKRVRGPKGAWNAIQVAGYSPDIDSYDEWATWFTSGEHVDVRIT